MRPVIIDLINAYEHNYPDANVKLKNHILRNPKDLLLSHAGMSVYGYAACMTLQCLKDVHESYLTVKDSLEGNKPYEIIGEGNRTALFDAVEYNLVHEVHYLVNDVGVNVNAIDKLDQTPLHFACNYSFMEIFNILMRSRRINVNVVDRFIKTPLYYAVKRKNVPMCKVLLRSGARINYHRDGKHVHLYTTYVMYYAGASQAANSLKRVFDQYMFHTGKRHQLANKIARTKSDIRQRLEEYKHLCDIAQDSNNMAFVMELAQRLRVHIGNKDKKQLCAAVSDKLNVLIAKPEMYSNSYANAL